MASMTAMLWSPSSPPVSGQSLESRRRILHFGYIAFVAFIAHVFDGYRPSTRRTFTSAGCIQWRPSCRRCEKVGVGHVVTVEAHGALRSRLGWPWSCRRPCRRRSRAGKANPQTAAPARKWRHPKWMPSWVMGRMGAFLRSAFHLGISG